MGVDITPVWNKSNREHLTIETDPCSVRKEADKATSDANWDLDYCVDADHINLSCVDGFIKASNFFTLDVADYIGENSNSEDCAKFVEKYKSFAGKLSIPGIEETFNISENDISIIAEKYLNAVKEAKKIYSHIESKKGEANFITEVSMDETENPQTPLELLFILAMIADEKIPAQTIAPKFSGRFNKGVDYVGDIAQFGKEFEDDLAVIQYAINNFGLSDNLKLSVHSGSDKFAIYPIFFT